MKNKIICIIFVLMVFGFTAYDMITPDREFSQWENRNLAGKPKVTAKTLLSGEFGADYETYMTDQFVGRDTFMKVKFLSDTAVGKRDAGNVYVTSDALYSIQPEPNHKVIDKSLSAIDSFASATGIPSYLTVVPSSTYIYRDLLPPFAPIVDEKEIFSHIEKNLKNASFINIMNKLEENSANYYYFRTDHHWTCDGALIGYNAFREVQGLAPLTKDSFSVSAVSTDFAGTLSSKSGALGIPYDTLERWDSGAVAQIEVWNGVESITHPSMYYEEYLDKKDKYSYYLGSNQPLVRIKTDSEGGRLLVFKDSYAHIMSPLMTGDWSEIVLVDLRYVREKIGVLLQRVTGLEMTDFDTALFLYSTETFTTQDNMVWIKP